MSYVEAGQMGYGEALVALIRFARLDQDKIEAIRAQSPTGA